MRRSVTKVVGGAVEVHVQRLELRRASAWAAVVAVAYAAAAGLGLALASPLLDSPAFWPAAGVGSAAVVLAARRSRPLAAVVAGTVLVAAAAVQLATGAGAAAALGSALAACVEAVVVAALFRATSRGWPSPMQSIWCLLVAAAGAVGASTTVAAVLVGPHSGTAALEFAVGWAVPDICGILLVGSLVLVPHAAPSGRWAEAAAQAGVLAALGVVAYWLTTGIQVAWVTVPALVWSAMRLGTTWTAAGSALVVLTSSAAAHAGRGPFGSQEHVVADLLAGQGFAATVVVTAMALACVAADREQTARHLALHDPLTGLANRLLLAEQAARILGRRRRHSVTAVLYCDLDGFKRVNDDFGHEVGDAVLRAAARRLTDAVRPTDVVARLGGDEFAVLCPALGESRVAEDIRRRIVEAFTTPVVVRGRTLDVRASVGLAVTAHEATLEDLLAAADRSMYVHKRGAVVDVRDGVTVRPAP